MRWTAAVAAALLLAATTSRDLDGIEGTVFEVAPYGSDDSPGTGAEPFATLERARDAIRELRRTIGIGDGVHVRLRAGTYCRDRTFELTEEVFGDAAAPEIYTATTTPPSSTRHTRARTSR